MVAKAEVSSKKKNRTHLEAVYYDDVVAMMKKKYDISNVHCIPKIEKIILNMRFNKSRDDRRAIEAATRELSLISCQKPTVSRARKSIAGFKLRKGSIVGAFVTLRGQKLFQFLERLIYIAFPRVRDFRGFTVSSFDKDYNLTIGINDFLVFQELDYDRVHKIRGLEVTFVTNNITSEDMAIDFFRAMLIPIHV